MSVLNKLVLLALGIFAADSTRDSTGYLHQSQPTEKQQQAAQSLVASLLRERRHGGGDTVAHQVSGRGGMQWVPASSLEAQQGGSSYEEADAEIRAELEEVLSKDLISVFEDDFASIKKELHSTYMAIPKNEYGELEQSGVRYALHRLFVARHGWYIQGIDPQGDALKESSPADLLKGHVPTHVQRLIEKMLHGRGFGLSEVALLGAILENQIHHEGAKRLATVFGMFDVDREQMVEPKDVDLYIDLYMVAHIMGRDVAKMSKEELMTQFAVMSRSYPSWEETQMFTRKIREEKYGDRDLTFKEATNVILAIGDRHGSWQQRECVAMKKQMMDLEAQKDGCVPVANFYKGMRDSGKWQFSESPDYLRELGALDESNPKNMRVMIPNYLDGLSNCVASSSYYSVCCINECEEIMGRIEKHVLAPDASAEELARLVAALPSVTMPAHRTLPATLVQHLDQIAKAHGGRVPLHSRLFMQWMHNAYPHECPYPHISGKTTPRLPEVWMADSKKDATVTKAEMDSFAAQAAVLQKTGQCGQWLDQEELYVPWKTHPAESEAERDAYAWAGASTAALLTAVASMLLMLIQTARHVRSSSTANKDCNMIIA